MNIEQIYTGCLAQGAYYITDAGEAAIIDPLRETQDYLDRAAHDGVTIKYIFETHFHADFVSGHVTLAKQTGAPIIYGPLADPKFDAHIATDGEEFKIGRLTLRVLHTPGHTMESTSYLLLDEHGKEVAIFTGDTLFLGDVGRPDLAQKSGEMTIEDLAGYSFDSLRNKIMPLPDNILVYPAHGAGSACGKNMMKETVDTLGHQKETNYALRADMTKEEFIKEVTEGLMAPPAYFPFNVQMNKEGYADISTVLETGLKPLSPSEFERVANESHAILLDVRHQDDFAKSHIPNSIFIGLDGDFAPWVGELIINVTQPILLITPEGKEQEAVTRLSRVGFDHTLGYLKGGIGAWKNAEKELESVPSIRAEELAQITLVDTISLFDMRKPSEYQAENMLQATNIPLSELNSRFSEFDGHEPFYIHCAGGYRSMIAASILKSRGYHAVVDVAGGFDEIKKTNAAVSNYVCPSTL